MRYDESDDLVERMRVLESERCALDPDEADGDHGEGELRWLRRAYDDLRAERWAQPHPPGRDLASRTSPW